MAKVKNKKSKIADSFTGKTKSKKLNKFELHINRTKQDVLRRQLKSDRGLPGVSRARAINKRKQTLLKEYQIKDKDNILLDKRIGERNKSMTEQEKMMLRFTAERVKAHKKKNIFNLNDGDEILTHKGQSVMEIEKFDDVGSDDDSDDEAGGRLGEQFVEDAHFAGGLFSNSESGKMSHRDLIDKLIAESKKRKAEKKKLKEDNIDATEKLDAEWKDLLPLLADSKRKDDDDTNEKVDDYDKAVRMMKFDARAIAGEKLKSQEEMDKEEAEYKEKMEKERLNRMQDSADKKVVKHKSADDLDFDYLVEKVEADEEDGDEHNSDKNESDDDEEESENEANDEEENQEDEEEEHNVSIEEEKEEEGNVSVEDEDEAEAEEESDSEDDLSDLKASESSSEEEDEEEEKVKTDVIEVPSILIKSSTKEVTNEKVMKNDTKNSNIPCAIPNTLEELEELLCQYTHEQKSVVIDKIIKSNKKKPESKEKFARLFDYLLQYLDKFAHVDSNKDVVELFKVCSIICPYLYDLAHENPEETSKIFINILQTKHGQYENNRKKYPGLDVLIFFKVASLIYPSSDFRHQIMTPCYVFMSQILMRCRVKNRRDIAKGVFISALMLENTYLTKRFAPSVMNFLRGILYTSLPKNESLPKIKTILPFKSFGPERNLLVLDTLVKKSTKYDSGKLRMRASDMLITEIDDDFKIRIVATAVNMVDEFAELLQDLPAAYVIFGPIEKLLTLKVLKSYPKEIRNLGSKLHEKLKRIISKTLEYLVLPQKKPKALRLYEPRIEPIYEGKKHRTVSREKAEQEKMIHKLKKETKNAMREIRRDNAFLAKVRIGEQIRSDEERKRKVKEIFADAAVQQGEFKKLKRNN